ncbi:hypothetical protein E2C01_073068 [Portunus trituberculatus]|uniref:Uncharacterized protein n=1 Tax=Portunus trituberculatus TaxID=210409 RepID=A0A5B7ICD0_PORTR|nr:hypothetical protein [Portunus trituberculatus]
MCGEETWGGVGKKGPDKWLRSVALIGSRRRVERPRDALTSGFRKLVHSSQAAQVELFKADATGNSEIRLIFCILTVLCYGPPVTYSTTLTSSACYLIRHLSTSPPRHRLMNPPRHRLMKPRYCPKLDSRGPIRLKRKC